MKKECNCKLCHKAIVVEIDDAYAELGDYLKLIPMATCNRCADYVTRRNRLSGKIFKTCNVLIVASNTTKPAKLADAKRFAFDNLCILTKAYARVVADFYGCNYWWDEEFVRSLMESPGHAGTHLINYMTTYKRDVVGPARAQQEMPV